MTKYQSSVKSLAKKKKSGEKVGCIKFKSEGTSIFLKQHGAGKTYEVLLEKNRIKLAMLKKPLRVNGMKQFKKIAEIDENFEFSSATLDRDMVGDYFFHVTVWVDRNKWESYQKSKEVLTVDQIGIDFGC